MRWQIQTYTSLRGEKPVDDFITKQSFQARSKFIHLIDLLEKHGPILGMPYSKKIMHDLFELRIRGREEVRVFYHFHNHEITLLHAFKKKTQKTPQKEVAIALKRKHSLT